MMLTVMNINRLNNLTVRQNCSLVSLILCSRASLLLVVAILNAPLEIRGQDTLPLVKSFSYISPENQSFLNPNNDPDFHSGAGLAGLGDLDGNGYGDFAFQVREGTSDKGSIYILMMDTNGTVLNHHVLDSGAVSGLDLADGDSFGGRIAAIGDLDDDGVMDIAATANGDDTYATNHGAIYIVFLNSNGSAKSVTKFTQGLNGFTGSLANQFYNSTLTGVGDVNGDGVEDLLTGSYSCDIGGTDRGGIRYIYLNTNGTVNGEKPIHNNTLGAWPNSTSPLNNLSRFGLGITSMGDINGDEIGDVAVSAYYDKKVYILFMDSIQNISSYSIIQPADLQSTLNGVPHQFGWSLDNIGDHNGDGVNDLLITARFDDNAHFRDGSAMIVYLNSDGTVQSDEQIGEGLSTAQVGMGLHDNAWLGFQGASIGDIDGDKVPDIALTAPGHDGGGASGSQWGRLYTYNLNPKPIVLTTNVTSRTDTTLGSISYQAVGGVRPYSVRWNENSPTETEFEQWKSNIHTEDWASLGLPGFNVSSVTYSKILELTTPPLNSLSEGNHQLELTDKSGNTVTEFVDVGYEISEDTISGAVEVETGNYKKTAADGWTNMELVLENQLAPNTQGWIAFSPVDNTSKMAVGWREVGHSQLNGYEQMQIAILLDSINLKYWYDGSVHAVGSGTTYEAGDNLRLKRGIDSLYIYKNGVPLDTIVDTTITTMNLAADVSLYNSGGQLKSLTCSFPFYTPAPIVRINASVTNLSCDNPGGTGGIALTYEVVGDPNSPLLEWNFIWTGPPGFPSSVLPTINTNIPGVYNCVVSVSYQNQIYNFPVSYALGYKVDWVESNNVQIDPVDNHSLTANAVIGIAASTNQGFNPSSDFVARKVGGNPCTPITAPLVCYFDNFGFENKATGNFGVAGIVLSIPYSTYYAVFLHSPDAAAFGSTIIACSEGDELILECTSSSDVQLRNLSDPTMSSTLANAINAGGTTPTPYRIRTHLPTTNAVVQEPITSFECGPRPRALLTRKLSEAYHRADKKILRFGYWEDYNDNDLNYSVFAMDGQVVIDETQQPLAISYGYNELEIDMLDSGGNELDDGFYWLEVTNDKGIKRFLRFQYDNDSQ